MNWTAANLTAFFPGHQYIQPIVNVQDYSIPPMYVYGLAFLMVIIVALVNIPDKWFDKFKRGQK